jgi:hypothetical protein
MGLKGAAAAALMALSLILPACTSTASAATGTPPEVLTFQSAKATYNDFQYRYEGDLNVPVRFDFSVDRDWLNNTTATVHFIATMDPDYETKTDIYTGKEREVDISLAGNKHLDDGRMVKSSWKAEPSSIGTSDIVKGGADMISVNFTFRTAGSWKIYVVYDIPGTGIAGAESENARIYIKGDPDTVSGLDTLISLLLLVPMGAQALDYFRTRFARKRTG